MYLSQHQDEGGPQWGGVRESGGLVYTKAQLRRDTSGEIKTKKIVFNAKLFNPDHEFVQHFEQEGAEISFSDADNIMAEPFPS